MALASPKDRFRENPDLVKGFNDIVDSNQMNAAFDAAMMQMTMSLGMTNEHPVAAANAFRLQGAQMFLANLKTLNTAVLPTKPKTDTNLTQT